MCTHGSFLFSVVLFREDWQTPIAIVFGVISVVGLGSFIYGYIAVVVVGK